MRLIPVPATELDHWLPMVDWHLSNFAEAGHWTAQDFADQIRNRERQLWIVADDAIRAVGLTNVCADRLKTVQITHCAGEKPETWRHLLDGVAGWAKELGSEKLEIICRPGWERVLGLKKTHVLLEMRL